MMKALILAGILASASLGAQAGDFYILGDLGQSKLEASGDSESDTLFDLGAGFSLSENFAFELAYRDLGGPSKREGSSKWEVDISSLQLSMLGIIPTGDSAYLFGRLGAAKLELDETISGPGYNWSYSRDTIKALVGIGMGFKAIDALDLRVEYIQHAKWDELTVASISVGATYTF